MDTDDNNHTEVRKKSGQEGFRCGGGQSKGVKHPLCALPAKTQDPEERKVEAVKGWRGNVLPMMKKKRNGGW